MLFSANLGFLFRDLPLPESYVAAKSAGFDGVECGDVYSYDIQTLTNVKQCTRLQQVLLNTFAGEGKGFAAIPDREEEFRKSLETSIQYCTALNCKQLHILAGKFPHDTQTTEAGRFPRDIKVTQEIQKNYEATYIDNLRYASKVLSNNGITGLIEPISTIPNYFLTSTTQALDILDKLSCANIKLMLDLYHHQCTHGNIVQTLTDRFDQIGHIQVAQVPGRHEPDGNGEINYKFVLDRLRVIGYKGWIGCEYIPTAPDSFQWLRDYQLLYST